MKKEHLQEIKRLRKQLASIGKTPGIFSSPANHTYFQIRKDIPDGLHIEDYPVQVQIISVAMKALFMVTSTNKLFLNPISLGQIIASLDAIIAEEERPSSWNCIHPRIKQASMKLFVDGHYTDASVDAFIEINDAVKELFQRRHPGEEPPDGVDLMHKAFGANELKIGDDTETGRNIQQGFHFMFAGGIQAFRNPKAHSNKEKITAQEAMRRIMFASSLLYKLDEVK